MGLAVNHVSLKYGHHLVVDDVSFTVDNGQIVTLFGPSGVGKTTLLKMIAGLLPIKHGTIEFSADYSQSKTVLVFQDFWLFPHMTVFENIAFGLKARKLAKAEIQSRVAEMLQSFDLVELADHLPSELSGGQQQRVALARAMVLKPKLLLLDEPFSSLDTNLRLKMRAYLNQLQERYAFGVILVSHDKDEAFLLSDKLVVLIDGIVQQIGTPREIYDKPKSKQVADFVGDMNYLEGDLRGTDFTTSAGIIQVLNPEGLAGHCQALVPFDSKFEIVSPDEGLQAKILEVIWQPSGYRLTVSMGDQSLIFFNLPDTVAVGDVIGLHFLNKPRVLES